MKKFLKISALFILAVSGFFTFAVCVLIGAFLFLNSIGEINDPARNILNRFVAGHMYFEGLKLDFTEFPVVRLQAENGYMVSGINNYPTDTLCRFKKLDARMDILPLFDDSLTVYIPKVEVTDGFALVTIGKDGTPGWNVWRFKPPKPKDKKHKHGHREKLFINEVHLHGHSKFVYYNARRNRHMTLEADDVNMHGSIRIKYKQIFVSYFNAQNAKGEIYLKGGNSIIAFSSPKIELSSHLEDSLRRYNIRAKSHNSFLKLFGNTILHNNQTLDIGLNIAFSSKFDYIDIGALDLCLNNTTTVQAKAKYASIRKESTIWVNGNTPNIKQTFADLGLKLGKNIDNLKYALPVGVIAETHGICDFKNSKFPPIEISLRSNGGNIDIPKHGNIRNIDIFATVEYKHPFTHGLNVLVDRCHITYRNTALSATGKVIDVIHRPVAIGQIESDINLADLQQMISNELQLTGKMKLSAKFRIPLHSGRMLPESNITLLESSKLQNVKFTIPRTNAQVSIPKAKVNFKDIPGSKNVNIGISIPKANIYSPDEADIAFTDIDMNTDVTNLHNMVFPALDNGVLNFKKASFITPSNDTLAMRRFLMKFNSIAQKKEDAQINYFAILENMSYLNPDSASIFIKDIGIISQATMIDAVNLSPGNKYKLWDIIGSWDYRGDLRVSDFRATFPQLPILNTIPEADITFTKQDASLKIPKGNIGRTSILGDFKLHNWYKYIFNDSLLTLNAQIGATKIDMNQLLPAILQGAAYAQCTKNPLRGSSKFVAVPPNLNVSIDINAHNAEYGIAKVDTLSANIKIANQTANFDDVKFRSEIADIDMGFIYSTLSPLKADSKLDFNMHNLNLSQVFDFIPQTNKARPLLSSIKGLFDAKINASWEIDSLMQIVQPTLKSHATIEGTALSISKKNLMPRFLGWLLFGKAQYLTIDTLRLDMNIDNNRLTLSPLNFNLNKYRIGISGLMKDDAFFYHVALLKTPLRVRFGVNMYGTFNNKHFRLTSSKAPDENIMYNKIETFPMSSIIPTKFMHKESTKNNISFDYPAIYTEMRNLIIEGNPLGSAYIEKIHKTMMNKFHQHSNERK